MPATYIYTLEIWPPFALALAVALLGLYSWRRRTVPGARYFAIACLFWALSLLALTAEAAVVAPQRVDIVVQGAVDAEVMPLVEALEGATREAGAGPATEGHHHLPQVS